MARKIPWEPLSIEKMSKLQLFDGKVFKTYSPLDELITFILGHDQYKAKLYLISESTKNTYFNAYNTLKEAELVCFELVVFLLKHTVEEAATEFELTKFSE